MTRVVPDSDGRLLRESHELEIVAPLEVERTNWNLVYGQALNEIDFSEQLNQQVEAAHGEAITHLLVTLKPCSQNPFFLLWLFPFWPTCADVRLTGSIVRRSEASPPVSPVPDTAAPSAVPTPAQAPQTPQ